MPFKSELRTKRHHLYFLLVWLALCLFCLHMVIGSEIKTAEQQFNQDINELATDVQQKLLANDAVLSGFSAFLQAVAETDQEATARYAAAAMAPYPHIYMLEVAREVPHSEKDSLEESIRKSGLRNFSIKNFPLTTPLPETATTTLWPIIFIYPPLTFVKGEKGDCLLPAGATVKGWYAVLDGLVKLQSTSAEGRVSAFLGVPAGELFGEGSALKVEPRRYDVVDLRDTTLLCLPRTEFQALQEQNLPFNRYLVAHLNRRLGQAMALIEAGRLRSPEERVALYLSRVFWPGVRKLSLSQEELGHLVGLSRQTVNRVLRQMERLGLVSLAFGRVDILNEPALLNYPARA